MIEPQKLVVRTHVGRDLLQTSQLFRTLEAAAWEYVANSLEYVAAGCSRRSPWNSIFVTDGDDFGQRPWNGRVGPAAVLHNAWRESRPEEWQARTG